MKNKIPSAVEIETSLLGQIILSNECLDDIIPIISPAVFYDENNRIIYSVMLKMFDSGMPIDSVTLFNELKHQGKNIDAKYISMLSMTISSAANAQHHAKILFEKYLLRELLYTSKDVIKAVESEMEDAFDIHSNAVKNFEDIIEDLYLSGYDKTFWEEFPETISKIEELATEKRETGLTSISFPSFNKMTGGIKETDFTAIYGFEKQGKTTFALQLLLDFAIHLKIPVGYFSLEMSKESIYQKALSLRTGIDYNKLRSPKINRLTPEDMRDLIPEAEKNFKDTKILVCDKPLDKQRIKAKMKQWKKQHGVKAFVIDYISLIPSSEKYERRDLEIAAISRFFKLAAKELNVPIIMLSQSNNEGKVAESKALSRDADFVFSIKKPKENNVDSIPINGSRFKFSEDHFLVTLEYSRHGRNLFNLICGYLKNNKFKEIDPVYERELETVHNQEIF